MVAAIHAPTEPLLALPRQARRAVPHGHEWRLVCDDVDEFGQVRMYECTGCAVVRYE